MKLFVQRAAEQDILRQVEWYAAMGLPHIARRFHAAVFDAIDALQAMPGAGPPKFFDNPLLAGLRSWSVKGFDDFRVYYLAHAETLTIVRVLHGKRDLGTIFGSQDLEEP